jgi:3-phosphoshikimate 1-carboxyvinyltransferase
MDVLNLAPCPNARGTVPLPGSKSISNRTLLLAALAEGETRVEGLLASDDTQRMLEALGTLGVRVMQEPGTSNFIVQGCSGQFPVREADLFLGNAGTAFRPLTAALALLGGEYHLHGVPRMHERPIGDLVDALRTLGAQIDYLATPGFPPLQLHARQAIQSERPGLRTAVRGNVSSQFLTALLMALPLLGEDARVDVVGELISKPYIDITLNLMRRFGVDVTARGWETFRLPAHQRYRSPGRIRVEGDASSASYFLAAGAIGGGPVRVEGVGRDAIQGDVRFAETLARMGAMVELGDGWIEASGVRAAEGGRLKAIDADLNHIPDAAMTVAVLALFAEGTTTLRNIASWRVKETDRLSAMATELRKLGAMVEEHADALTITPPQQLNPDVLIHTYDDHRMAMCFSLVAVGGTPVRIHDPKCVAKTFPDYFEVLAKVAAA